MNEVDGVCSKCSNPFRWLTGTARICTDCEEKHHPLNRAQNSRLSCQDTCQLREQIERMEFITEVIKGVMQCSSEIQTLAVKIVIETLAEAEELGMGSNFRITVEKKVIEHLLRRYIERTCEEVEHYRNTLSHLVEEAINSQKKGHSNRHSVLLGIDYE